VCLCVGRTRNQGIGRWGGGEGCRYAATAELSSSWRCFFVVVVVVFSCARATAFAPCGFPFFFCGVKKNKAHSTQGKCSDPSAFTAPRQSRTSPLVCESVSLCPLAVGVTSPSLSLSLCVCHLVCHSAVPLLVVQVCGTSIACPSPPTPRAAPTFFFVLVSLRSAPCNPLDKTRGNLAASA
jgi:hypothetical protein